MMRKTYGSLPKRPAAGRLKVRCLLSMESASLQVPDELIRDSVAPDRLAEIAGEIHDRSLRETPRFAAALQEYSARHLIETMVEGLLQLTSNEIEGFSICPLVTESIRCASPVRAGAEFDVSFCAAIYTYYTAPESAAARAHDGHLELYRTYYRDVLVKFVERRMGQLLEPLRSGRDEIEKNVTRTLGAVLTELREQFPLEPYQERYEAAPTGADRKAGIVRKLCQAMRADAKRRLGL